MTSPGLLCVKCGKSANLADIMVKYRIEWRALFDKWVSGEIECCERPKVQLGVVR